MSTHTYNTQYTQYTINNTHNTHTCKPYTGPSSPRSLSVMVTSSPEVCMTWRQPATPNGVISLYRVYAEPLNTSRDIHVAIDLPITTVVKVYP